MRFNEIANPEDQLALWKLVSDKMWASFEQQPHQQSILRPMKKVALQLPSPQAKPLAYSPGQQIVKHKSVPVKAQKPKKVPIATAPKPLLKPKVQQLTPSEVTKKQTQQHRELAHQIQQALPKKNSANSPPQKNHIPNTQVAPTEGPISKSYNERDKDDLVIYQRQNPLKPLDLSLQKNHNPN